MPYISLLLSTTCGRDFFELDQFREILEHFICRVPRAVRGHLHHRLAPVPMKSAARSLTHLGPGLHVAPTAEGREEPIEVSIARDQREATFTARRSQQRVICQ